MSTQVVDVALVCALKEEVEAMLRHLPDSSQSRLGPYDCYYCVVERRSPRPIPRLRVVVVCLGRMGNLASLHASTLLLRELAPQCIILFGICGGILRASDDFRLGDLVVSDRVVYYEPAKTRPSGSEDRPVYFPRDTVGCPTPLMQAAQAQDRGAWTAETLIKIPRPRDSKARTRPKFFTGTVCSGEKVIADSSRAAALKGKFPDAVSIEMEAAGIAFACEQVSTTFLVVKGVSDYADERKGDSHRRYAAAVSAGFVYSLLLDTPVESRNPPKLVLADALQILPGRSLDLILPGYLNPRHPQGWKNYPFNLYESAYDDIYCAMKITSALQAHCGQGEINWAFHPEKGIGTSANVILVGSTVCNSSTRVALKEAYFRFGSGSDDHTITDPSGKLRYEAQIDIQTDGCKDIVVDYGLVTVLRKSSQCTIVLAGCRAYGQVLIGDFLTDANNVEWLYQQTVGRDYQLVIATRVEGRKYSPAEVCAFVARDRGGKWQSVQLNDLQ